MIICYIIPVLHGLGGAEVFVKRLACESRMRSIETHVFSIFRNPDDVVVKELIQAGVIIHSFSKPKKGFSILLALWLGWQLVKIRPSVIHSHLHVSKYLIPLRLLFVRAKWIHTIHNVPWHDAPGIEKIFNLLGVALGMRLVAISSSLADAASNYYKRQITSIPNGIPVSEIAPIEKFGKFVFGCMARLTAEKDLHTLISAFYKLHRNFPDTILLIAGEGPEMQRLVQFRNSNGLESVVFFLGAVTNPSEFWPKINAFVLSSKYEGMPMTILESMSMGIPVVAPNVGGISEMLDNGSCGFIYTSGDIEQLISSMRAVATTDCIGMVARAKKRCLEKYSISSCFSNYLSISNSHKIP